MLAEVEEAVAGGNNWVTEGDACAFHGGGLSPDTVLLGVQEECDGEGGEDLRRWSVKGDWSTFIPELDILEAELHRPLV